MENSKFILNEYVTTILNNRICLDQNNTSNIQNYTLNSKVVEPHISISIYLEHATDHRQILAEQWILSFKSQIVLNSHCGKQCQKEKQSFCCMLSQSPLYQNFISKQNSYKNYQLQITIDHSVKHQNLELYKCYHLNITEDLCIIARFHQHLNLSNEVIKQRSLSFQQYNVIQKQNNKLTRFNSEQIQTPEKTKVLMYSFEEDVTFLIDETQAEGLMSQNSDSDYMIQTIDEETDVTEWQIIDHKKKLTPHQKRILNSFKEIRNTFNLRHRHSHQIKIALQFDQ